MIGRVARACCALLLMAASPATAQTAPYSSLTVFGDSLVDAGNIRALGLGADPALGYANGRFTNGYDYTDLLSIAMYGTPTRASLLGGSNYAFGGARASDTSGVPDARAQVAAYGAALASGKTVDPTGLYVLNFGGNDVFAAVAPGAPAGYTSDTAFLLDAASQYAAAVQDLADLGARNILVTGFPVATAGLPLDLSIEAEKYLTTDLAGLSVADGVRVTQFSYLGFFGRVQADPSAFGLPPLILPDPSDAATTCQGAGALPDCTGYFSLDGIHPTAAIHRALYDDLNRQLGLGLPAVPEPATWAMMILGFALVGTSLRRRRVAAMV
ncbi:SGNH/GDSL hydrolase family protein [Sphingomonas folli]|uniref:SGNH/GDSL hydrolase family protein n=1 Tax=Sphingomonas folli TaxID=2862497 RepID=UPI0021563368|nr:SGNH/GDSL hydrolase family protein [Sphingomonas folli]